MSGESQTPSERAVVGADGHYIGAFVTVRGDALLVAARASHAPGQHFSLPLEIVTSIDTVITLKHSARDVIERWLTPSAADALVS